uniref:ATP-binding cassette domain-containing protein n=1 Tax=Pseudactinotalea sp. TaxID=1926260 RepID=UPI003B3AE00E
MSTPALSLRNLTLDLPTPAGPVRILHGVDLEVGRGEIVGLVGESGSGKSLTALSVLGLLPRGAEVGGTVELDGTDLLEAPARVLRTVRGGRVGMVFQDPMTTLDPVMRVGRQIGEAYRIHHRDAGRREVRRRTFELLELVGVPDAAQRARQYPHQWSGGMRQRAVIAMALAND